MDNFFEILIYVIIIVSFLSSIFKKKKQQQQKPPAQANQPEEYTQADVSVAQTQPKEEYDVLKEIEDFFKVGGNIPGQEETTVAQPEEPISIIQTKEQAKSDSWHTPTASEHAYSDNWERKSEEVKKKISQVDSGIEKQAAKFEESLVKIKPNASEIISSVKTKFKNPSTLKEYIIFSEILGKPKAFRRR
jgi:type IV secretory pathway VirB10-like protein